MPEPDRPTIRALLTARGWAHVPGVVPPPLLDALRADLDGIQAEWRFLQHRNGVGEGTDGTLHHVAGRGTAVDSFLAALPLHAAITDFLGGGPYVLNACGGILGLPGAKTYAARIHRDVRGHSPGYPILVNLLVMLDDFTAESGATWMFSGSHRLPERPSEALFVAHAEPALGRAGDAVIFDSHLWHRAGANRSGARRRALTISYSRPFVKPQVDHARMACPETLARHGEPLRQLFGLNARVPENLHAFYQPPERRSYRADQE